MPNNNSTGLNAGVLLGGLALTAISAANTDSAAAPVISEILGFLSGLASNEAQGWLKERAEVKYPDYEDVFGTHSIPGLVNAAIRTGIREAVSRIGRTTGIDAALDGIPDLFKAALEEHDSEHTAPAEKVIPGILSEYASLGGFARPISAATWEAILTRLPIKLWPLERPTIAEGLHAQVPATVWSLASREATSNRQTFLALELLYLARILKFTEGVELNARAVDSVRELTTRMVELIAGLEPNTAEYFESVFADSAALRLTNREHQEIISSALEQRTAG